MTLQLTAYMGTESTVLREDQAHCKALHLAALHLPNGHTVTVGHGRWMSPERGLVSEKCVMVMVWADRGSDVHKAFLAMCADYKAAAAQDAVGVTVQEVDLDFV